MNYSNQNNVRVLTGLKSVQEALHRIAHLPMVESDEVAESFIKGYGELMSLNKATREEIGGLSVKDLLASEYSSDIKTAVGITSKALGAVSDATSRKAGQNARILQSIKEKSMHTETRSNYAQAVELVDSISSMAQENGIDIGWMMAYDAKSVLGKDEMEVEDIIGQIRFQQLTKNERVTLTGLGSEEREKVGYDRFGGGVRYMNYDMANSAYRVNEILTGIRLAYLRIQAAGAYREIFRQGAKNEDYGFTAYPYVGTDATTQDKSFNAAVSSIHSLNEAFRKMKLEAGQIRKSPNKKGTDNQDQAPLMITPATTGIVFFNEKWNTRLDQMRRISGGDNGINPRLLHNFLFIPSHLAAISGGWKADSTKQRDEHGLFGGVKEVASIEKMAVRLVIPGQRNIHGMFQGLSFAQETSFLDEETTIAAYAREKFVADHRQTARVQLEA